MIKFIKNILKNISRDWVKEVKSMREAFSAEAEAAASDPVKYAENSFKDWVKGVKLMGKAAGEAASDPIRFAKNCYKQTQKEIQNTSRKVIELAHEFHSNPANLYARTPRIPTQERGVEQKNVNGQSNTGREYRVTH
jgi:vacuolar-type H+-ATPase subunit E/Vma4